MGSPKSRGWSGEKTTERELLKLNKGYNKLLNNVYMRSNTGKLSQIDHILITKTGIFVIETKNLRGTIYGSMEDQTWTQVRGRRKIKIYNPCMQNESHIETLRDNITTSIPIISVICFSNQAILRVGGVTEAYLTSHEELLRVIVRYKGKVYSNKYVNTTYRKIKESVLVGEGVKKEHLLQLRAFKSHYNW